MPNPSSAELAAQALGHVDDVGAAGDGSLIAVLKWIRDHGAALGGGSTLADGADVAEGTIADIAVTGDVAGTLSAKLRGLSLILDDVHDAVNHQLKVSSAGGAGGGLTDAELRATPVPVSGPLTDAQLRAVAIHAVEDSGYALTDAQLRAAAVPMSVAALPLPAGAATQVTLAAVLAALDVALSTRASEATLALVKAKTDNLDVQLSTRAVTGLTDAQLRAAAVPVSGPVTDAQLRAAAVPVSGAMGRTWTLASGTDAVAVVGTVAVSGEVEIMNDLGNPIPVSGPLTDAQLRVAAVPVSAASPAAVADQRIEIAAVGVAVQFPALAAKTVAITADWDNEGILVIGGATVVASRTARRGLPLGPGDTAVVAVANLSLLYADGTVRGDAASYAVLS